MQNVTPWKPAKSVAVLYGIFLQPFAMLYVNRAGWFWIYVIAGFCIALLLSILPAHNSIRSIMSSGLGIFLFALITSSHAFIVAKHYGDEKRRWYARWWVVIIALIGMYGVIVSVKSFLIEPYSIPAASMSPTLKIGDHLLISKLGYGNYRTMGFQIARSTPTTLPKRGEIIVFQYPLEPGIDYVKRVIGLPGDVIVYNHKTPLLKPKCEPTNNDCPDFKAIPRRALPKNTDHINLTFYEETLGQHTYQIQLNEERTDYRDMYFQQPDSRLGEWVVPNGHYFVLGDNRDNSRDSRFWGFVSADHVVGKVLVSW